MRAIWMTALLAVGGCATTGGPGTADAPRPIEAESIRFATSPCFGTCPVYAVTVQPDGRGTFEGIQHTAVTGVRSFTIDQATYDRFAAALGPHRPAEGDLRIQPGEPRCKNAPTDMPGVEVRWSDISGGGNTLSYYAGCRLGNEALARALEAAPGLLPIESFIGRRK